MFTVVASGRNGTRDNRFRAGSFLDQIVGQRVRAAHAKGRFSLVVVVGARIVVAEHPRLPQAEIGDLEVRIAVLEGCAGSYAASGC